MNFDELFNSMIGQDPELNSIDADAVAAEVAASKPAKDGLAYVGDVEGANGHAISVYALTVEGKRVLDVLIDNFVEVPVPAEMGKVPAGVTAHPIMVAVPGESVAMATSGLAFRTPHQDGTGTHIDGKTVQSYIYPRAVRFIVQMYVA